MGRTKNNLVLWCIFCIVLSSPLISSQIELSDKNVRYDAEINDLFSVSDENAEGIKLDFLEHVENKIQESYLKERFLSRNIQDNRVYVRVHLRDESGVVFNGSMEENRAMLKIHDVRFPS